MNDEPIPIEERCTEAVNPRLAALVMRCVEKSPDDRPQSCEEILGELDEIEVEVPWSRREARDWWDLHMATPGMDALGSTRILTE